MSTITTRAGKGSPLTNTEVDNNFTNLNTDKLETSGGTLTGNLTINGLATLNSNLAIIGTAPTVSLLDSTTDAHDFYIHANSNIFYVLTNRDGSNPGTINTGFETPHPLMLTNSSAAGHLYGQRIFADDYHPNADKWTTPRTLTLTGDVTGSVSWDGSAGANLATVVGNDTHTHDFNNLTGKTLGEGEYSTNSYLTAGRGTGGVSLTVNDGYGNANVTFNHKAGIPEQNGSALRIETNTDTAGKGVFTFEASSAAVTAGTAINLPTLGTWDVDELKIQTGLLVSHVPTSAQSGIVYPAIIEANDSGNVNDYVLGDGVGIQFKIGTNPIGSEYSQVGASIAAIREATTDTSSNTGLGLFISQNNETLDEALRIDNVGNADFKLGTIKMGGTALVTQNRDVTPRKVNIVSSENDALKLQITDDVANRARNAMHIDFNLSGADATTADRVKAALRIDVDSTATGGDTNHEHRVYGITNDVRISGDSDIVYGQNNYVETQHSAGTTGTVYGDYTLVVIDETGSGRTTTATGTYGYVNVTSSGTGGVTSNTYGGYFRSLCGGTQEKNITNMHGMMAEVEIDNSANGVTVDNAYVVRAYYDNDVTTGDVVVTNSYLFHGAYAGTLPSNAQGVYIGSDVPNYFRGSVDVRGDDGLMVKNASDTHLAVKVQTDLASDFGITRFYGANGAQVGFLIGYGSTNTTPNEISIKATHAAGAFSVFTNGQRRLRVQNALTTVTTPMVVDPVTDVSFTSTGHAFQIGAVGGANMRFDTNEIMSVNADGTSHDLRLQHSGGKVLVNNDLILEGHKIATNGSTLDFSVDNDGNGSNQQFRWSEGGTVRMVLEDNDLYVHDNISAGRRYESGATNLAYDTTSSHVSAYAAEAADGSQREFRTFIQAYNTTDPDVAVFQCFSKDVMADTATTTHNEKSTAHILDNGGRVWSWSAHYAGRVRVGSTATTNAYRAADNSMTAYSGTGNAHGHTTYAGYTTIAGKETANGDDVFAHFNEGQFRIEFDASGNGRFDGGADISAADYAEYFEWADGNPDNEDRRGHSVILNSDGKIRIATASDTVDDIIGIVSVEAAVVGDSAWAAWTGKYERDRFGQTVYEDYELLCWGPYDEDSKSYKTQTTRQAMIDAGREADIPEDAITVVKQRQKLAADYDPDREYIPRKDRQEWQAIGLMGKLPLLDGQPTAPQWRKLFDLNDEVEMWLVR